MAGQLQSAANQLLNSMWVRVYGCLLRVFASSTMNIRSLRKLKKMVRRCEKNWRGGSDEELNGDWSNMRTAAA